MTEREAEDEEDSLDEKWQELQNQKTDTSIARGRGSRNKKLTPNSSNRHFALAAANLSYHKGSCKRLTPNETHIMVKQAVRKKADETSKLSKRAFEKVTQSMARKEEWISHQRQL